MTPTPPRLAPLLVLLLGTGAAWAQSPGADCAALTEDSARLACYDRLHGRAVQQPAAVVAAPAAPPPARAAATATATTAATGAAALQPRSPRSRLAARWDLDGQSGELFSPRAYLPVYLLPVTWTDQVNRRPNSPAPNHSVPLDLNLRATETKYQLSLKSKLGQNLLGSSASLWGGYTQSSRWQVYNGAASRPFRETNYEPELMLVWPLQAELAGWQLRMGALALTHESNGRSQPLSRSWNRVIGTLAAERGDWVLELKPWLRISEQRGDDDNPDIEDQVGRGELLLTRYWGEQALSLQLRHSLRGGARSRGSAQMDWVFPLNGALHGYVQVFSGRGESLIDYNLQQTKVGVGVTIAGWR